MAFWADGITKAWHLEKRKVHVAPLTNTTYIIMSYLPVSGKRWVWIMKHKYSTKMWLLVGSRRHVWVNRICKGKKKKIQFYVFTLIPFISCVGEGWVQAGLRPGQRRLREAGSAASARRSTEHVLEGAVSCSHHPTSLPILILQQHYNFLSAADALFLCLTIELFNISAGVHNKEGCVSFIFNDFFFPSLLAQICENSSVSG